MSSILVGIGVHPAIPELLKSQRQAIIRRILRSFSNRRRIVLSSLSILFALIWLGNAILSILFREPLNPERFASSVPLGLTVYTLWHLMRTTFKRPEVGIEWTPAEIEQLVGRPFHRRDLLAYRFSIIVNAAVIKAVCFSILMLPDLKLWLAGFIGALLGLLFVDLWRMFVEIWIWGMHDKTYRYLKYGLATIITGFVASSLIIAFSTEQAWQRMSTPASIGMLGHLLAAASSLRHTLVGQACEAPVVLFANLITATSWSAPVLASLLGGSLFVLVMFGIVIWTDRHYETIAAQKERSTYRKIVAEGGQIQAETRTQLRLPRITWLFGFGPLVWRQAKGALLFRSSLLFSLAIPGVLACLPLFVYKEPNIILLNVLGALVFYSFLLLPTALKFDFRRDLDRMVILKSLPLRPLKIVCGQLTTPVIIATVYQLVVMLCASAIRPLPMHLIAASMLLLLPLNVLIFAIDNIFFLLYPYRINQEGFAIFLRTTLTFTAKGVMFFIALSAIIFWALSSRLAANALQNSFGLSVDHRILFSIGLWIFIVGLSVGSLNLLTRAFIRFDLSQDMPQ